MFCLFLFAFVPACAGCNLIYNFCGNNLAIWFFFVIFSNLNVIKVINIDVSRAYCSLILT